MKKKTLSNFRGWCTQLFLALALFLPPPHVRKSKRQWVNQCRSLYVGGGTSSLLQLFCCCSNANTMDLVTEHSGLPQHREAWIMQKWHKNLPSSLCWDCIVADEGEDAGYLLVWTIYWALSSYVQGTAVQCYSKTQNGKSQCAHGWVGSPVSFYVVPATTNITI